MRQAVKYLPNYTREDYERWEGQWELIQGIPYAMSPSPTKKHQLINTNLCRYWAEALDQCDQCQALMPLDFPIGNDTVLQPDFLIACNDPDNERLTVIPSLVCEILSPSTVVKDRNLKFQIYQETGVKYYLIIDAETDSIEVYHLDKGIYQLKNQFKKGDNYMRHRFFLSEACSVSMNFTPILQ